MQFKLSSKEQAFADKLIKEYKDKIGKYPNISYTFYPTGIGNKIELRFHGAIKRGFFKQDLVYDITDYDSW